MVVQIAQFSVVEHLLFDVLSDFLELLVVLLVLELIENIGQQSVSATIESSLAESLNKVCLSWDVELVRLCGNHQTEKFSGCNVEIKLTT